ncbi:hypothetical protein WA158_007165 [Blastocystis sp. Blastoise]
MVFSEIFGESLHSHNGPVATSTLEGKYVALYFSAHWCAPCRQFTPKFAETYKSIKDTKNFEVVFCSKDKDEAGFKEYFDLMPWLAINYSDEVTRTGLETAFGVHGIPTVVLFDPEGNVINTQAKPMIESNPAGFPWKEPTLFEIMEGALVGKNGPVAVETLKNKVLGLYFSAHWCGPCRQFTPILKKNYNALKQQGKDFEVVFCSADRVEKEYNEYYETMPWLSLGFKSQAVEAITTKYHVQGYPTLLLFDIYGNLLTEEGRAVLSDENAVANYPWMPKACYDLNAEPDGINNGPCLILLNEYDCCSQEVKQKNAEVINACGEIALQKGEATKLCYFYAVNDGEVSQQIRGFIKSQECPMFLIVDLPDNGGYYLPTSQEITQENIRAFVQKFLLHKAERLQMSA